jgi:hypothetical protein
MVLRQWPLCQKKEDGSLCFSPNDSRANEVVLGNEKVCLLKQMKILGLIFDSKLNWYYQTVNAIENANKAKQALRIISKFFSTQEMVKLSTALFYSRLYYGAKVWLSSALSVTLKKKLWQASSKMLKICQKDWQGQFSFKTLHKISGRATPEMWSNYSAACGMYNVNHNVCSGGYFC